MTVVSVTPHPDTLSMTLVARFAASIERVWQVWADPRQLERWWGPPTWPATFTHHDLRVGGGARYTMHGPDGASASGWWRFTALEEPSSLELVDGFAHPDGTPDESLPSTTMTMRLEEVDGLTRMTVVSRFPSEEAMAQMVEMGMVEGISAAAAQIDDVLAGRPAPTPASAP